MSTPIQVLAGTSRAVVSADGMYRYQLQRWWDQSQPPAVFIMLNPSVADASHDDPTVRRVTRFAASWGCGGVVVVNLFAYITPYPSVLSEAEDPVGPRNDAYLVEAGRVAANTGGPLVAAWGAGAPAKRVRRVLSLPSVGRMCALGSTIGGHPRHPGRLRADTPLQTWREAS